MTKEKTPEELAQKEVNKRVAKALADIEIERRRLKARIKKLDRKEKKILDGELVPNSDGSLPDDEDEDNDSSSDSISHVAILLDESGSMCSYKDQVIEGFNDYISKLKNNGTNIKITLTKFDSRGVNTVYRDKSLNNVPKLNEKNYQPNAMTPLYDAIGKTVNKIRELKKVLFIIQTDGLENASREYTLNSVSKLIQGREKLGWDFVYLGADIDAWADGGRQLGLSKGQTYSYKSWDTYGTFSSGASCYTVGWANGTLGAADFSLCMSNNSSKRNKAKSK